jgi:hypothetical protein
MSADATMGTGFVARMAGRDPDEPRQPPGPSAVGELLREWRSAERLLDGVEPGSDAWSGLRAEIDRLRERYQEAFDALSHSDPTGTSG